MKIEQRFIKTVWDFYATHKRADLPWRQTSDPYCILVSELMLQQTQVDRVRPKYVNFIARWETVRALAHAPLADILAAWQGLGYNRRAKFLQQCAITINTEYDGVFPYTYESLQALPGVGPYTAGAIMAFAYNQPVPIIETNIRTALLHHFFQGKNNVTESQLLQLTGVVLDQKNPREWYWALMDYGSHLKATVGNINAQAKSYNKQSKFAGSDRQIRGAIIRALVDGGQTWPQLQHTLISFEAARVAQQLAALCQEVLVIKQRSVYSLPK